MIAREREKIPLPPSHLPQPKEGSRKVVLLLWCTPHLLGDLLDKEI